MVRVETELFKCAVATPPPAAQREIAVGRTSVPSAMQGRCGARRWACLALGRRPSVGRKLPRGTLR